MTIIISKHSKRWKTIKPWSEWHPTKNNGLKPEDFSDYSNKKVWWKCPEGEDHEWRANINNRSRGTRCPFCSGKKVSKTNNLLAMNPKLASEWHPKKNGDLKPEDFTLHSSKKFWWQCPKGEDHEWATTINNRSRVIGGNCPFCAGQKTSKTNNLLARNPELAREWHPTKNKDLKPEDFVTGSSKKVWWKCSEDEDHEWEASIYHRSHNESGCPFCTGRKTSATNNLLALSPKVASEWHPSKNGDSRPEDFTLGSNKKVWWQCPKGEDHEWVTRIAERASFGSNCPYCANQKVSQTNNLLALNPQLASEWHPTKNKELKPEDVVLGSSKKVWWQCSKSEDHEWKTTIASRNSGRGCPICNSSSTSHPEIRILCELKLLMGAEEVKWRERISGVEIDVFIPLHNLGIEYDGSYWHKDKILKDKEKNEFFQKKNIQIIRVRDYPLKKISKYDIVTHNKNLTKNDLNTLIIKVKSFLKQSYKVSFDSYINNSGFLNERDYKRFISFLPAPPPEYSIAKTHPEILKQWHYKKNNPLTPHNFTSGSGKKVWWQCPKGEDHIWEASIAKKSNGSGCPFCSGVMLSQTSTLLSVNPQLASEWHPNKNKSLKPEDVSSKSHHKFWWQCPKDADHEWEATINNRNRNNSNCPYCTNQKVSQTNNLLALNPQLASEWHPTKNKDLKPEDVVLGSSKKVWWQCHKGADHEWDARISSRNRGNGCPFCSGRRKSNINNY